MNRIERVVVDECVGQESPLLGQLCQRLGERPVRFVFLASEHPGIPDIEILDKLMDARSALLTQDRVLHNLAIRRGFRSFVHTPESGLTDRRLAHVSAPDKNLPVASGAVRDSYLHQSSPEAQAITECLYGFLSAHQLKQFRTKRRRIRAHFGSPDNIMATALTIGQRRTAHGMVGGYMLKVDARHAVKSLFPASESYFLDHAGNEPLQATCWALVHLFQLQLQSYPLTLYHIDGAALVRCSALIDDRGAAATAVERMAARLLAAVSRPNAAECKDRVSVGALNLLLFVQLLLAGPDAARLRWSATVPVALQILGLVGFAMGMRLTTWAMLVNRFFSQAVRLQPDKAAEGHVRGSGHSLATGKRTQTFMGSSG